jgi:hypothetical protein
MSFSSSWAVKEEGNVFARSQGIYKAINLLLIILLQSLPEKASAVFLGSCENIKGVCEYKEIIIEMPK